MKDERDGVILHFSGDASTAAKVKVFAGNKNLAGVYKGEVTSIPSDKRLMIYEFTLVCDSANAVQVFDDTAAASDSAASSSATLGTAIIDGSFPANGGQSTTTPVPFGFKSGMRPTIKASGSGIVRFVAFGRIV